MFSFYCSSRSEWEKHAWGNLLDGYEQSNRFSVHTEDEYDPFIVFSADEFVELSSLSIVLREKYENKILPVKVLTSFDKVKWSELSNYELVEETSTLVFKDVGTAKFIKIVKEGYGCLYFSAVNFFCHKNYLEYNATRLNNIEKENFVLSYTPFYGLGGQLAVLATAIGQALVSQYKRCFWTWRDYQSGLVMFPPELPKNSYVEQVLQQSVSSAVFANFTLNKERQKSSRSVSGWLPSRNVDIANSPVAIISRNDINQFILRGESKYQCMRRLYSKILPSSYVQKLVVEQANLIQSKGIDFSMALGIQVRHGNGERYKQGNTWGVKPPPKAVLISAVDGAIQNAKSPLDSIIIASDCFAVRDVLQNKYGRKYKIHFLSENIQNIGGGGNPQDFRFDMGVERIEVDMEQDDKQAFAEIITLSKCNSICGGKSFFFDAVIGFGNADENQITRIDNRDRYVELAEHIVPLGEAEGNEIASFVIDLFRRNDVLLDGIFICLEKAEDMVIKLSFFDELLFEGNQRELVKSLAKKAIKEKLVDCRYY
jgi:hypothetical protein